MGELPIALCGVWLGLLLRSDALDAQKKLRQLFLSRKPLGKVNTSNSAFRGEIRILNFCPVRVNGR